jgi:DNA-binding XRE family transcriptional regulator
MHIESHGLIFDARKDGTISVIVARGKATQQPKATPLIAILKAGVTADQVRAALKNWQPPRMCGGATSRRRKEACDLLDSAGLLQERCLSIGTRLHDARLAAGLKQTAVAEAIGVAQNTVSGWELGKATPDVPTFAKLADLYGVTMESLV